MKFIFVWSDPQEWKQEEKKIEVLGLRQDLNANHEI